MNDLQKKFEKWKVEREVDEYNESYGFREGYVKAMCDAINLVKNLDISLVSNSLPLTYETLPNKIKEMMFEKHAHAELLDPEEICYKESDVINIINAILGNDR